MCVEPLPGCTSKDQHPTDPRKVLVAFCSRCGRQLLQDVHHDHRSGFEPAFYRWATLDPEPQENTR